MVLISTAKCCDFVIVTYFESSHHLADLMRYCFLFGRATYHWFRFVACFAVAVDSCKAVVRPELQLFIIDDVNF